jgi:hypothetical protein
MATPRLPGGGKPWFVRTGPLWYCNVVPVSPAGWILTIGYALAVVGVSLLLLRDDPGLAEWAAWGAFFGSATILFLVTTLNMAAPDPDRSRGCSAGGRKG